MKNKTLELRTHLSLSSAGEAAFAQHWVPWAGLCWVVCAARCSSLEHSPQWMTQRCTTNGRSAPARQPERCMLGSQTQDAQIQGVDHFHRGQEVPGPTRRYGRNNLRQPTNQCSTGQTWRFGAGGGCPASRTGRRRSGWRCGGTRAGRRRPHRTAC